MKPSASIVRRVRALGFTDAEIRRYLRAMQRTPSGRSAGPEGAERMRTDYAGISFAPPREVRERAVEALEWRFRDGHPGGTDIGVGRALQLAVEDGVPPRDIDRMVAYGTRHRVDLDSVGARKGAITPGVVAWGLWGGHAGIAWARRVQAAMRARDAERGPKRRARRNPPARKPAPSKPLRPRAIDSGEVAGWKTLAAALPVGWSEDYAPHLRRIVAEGRVTIPAAALESGALAALLRLGLIRTTQFWTAAQMLYSEDVYDIEPTQKGVDTLARRDAWYDAQARRSQVGLFGNPAPGYQSWAWTTQDWRVVVPHADGTLSYGEVCGGASNRTHAGHVRLCLPVAVIRALDGDAGGRKILHAQALRKQRAERGARIPWHPVIRELWRVIEARTEADDPRRRSHK
jgi:hypothetical protein